MEDRGSSLSDEKDRSPCSYDDEIQSSPTKPDFSPTKDDTKDTQINSPKDDISPTKDDDPLPESSNTPTLFNSGTYVVQVPKDQIYRVPPPEHALMAERHQNGNDQPKRSSCCCCCVPCISFPFRRNKLAKESRVTSQHKS